MIRRPPRATLFPYTTLSDRLPNETDRSRPLPLRQPSTLAGSGATFRLPAGLGWRTGPRGDGRAAASRGADANQAADFSVPIAIGRLVLGLAIGRRVGGVDDVLPVLR